MSHLGAYPSLRYHSVELLILQLTPFCNIDCSYCYLLDRKLAKVMTREVAARAIDAVFAYPYQAGNFTIVLHSGEPLAAPFELVQFVCEYAASKETSLTKANINIQTNGTLISDRWCELFTKHSVSIGLSLDGPQHIHDRYRKDRAKRGTFERVMAGVRTLRRHNLDFDVISVLTGYSTSYAHEYFAFMKGLAPRSLSMNIDEIDGANEASTICDTPMPVFKRFIRELAGLWLRDGKSLNIREFSDALALIAGDAALGTNETNNQTNDPFRIISIAHDGAISTFAPELLSAFAADGASFAFGNILDVQLEGIVHSAHFQRVYREIGAGISECRSTCELFAHCRGGSPSNKLAERGSFSVGETMECLFTKKMVLDATLEAFETHYSLSVSDDGRD